MEKELIYKMKMVLCYRQELQIAGVDPEGIAEFWENLKLQGVVIRRIPKRQGEQDILKQICQHKNTVSRQDDRNIVVEFAKEEILVIAATDETIHEAMEAGVAVFAWKNTDYQEESLMASPFLVESFDGVDYEYVERIWRRFHKLPWNILTTSRCYVRELTMEDLDDLFYMYQQEGMTKYMEPLYERDEEMEYQKAYIENMYGFYGYGMWLVFDQVTDALIGRAGIENRELHGTYELELGYAITPAYQRKGYATEVCQGILVYARGHLEAREINCLIQKENYPSLALAKKLGFCYLETIELEKQLYERYVYTLSEENKSE